MRDLIDAALEDAFKAEICHTFRTISTDIAHRGGHRKAAQTLAARILDLRTFYNEVVGLIDERSDS
jgi:hypothetical protein